MARIELAVSALIVFLSPLATENVAVAVASFEPDYERAIELSLTFFESQRSGRLPGDNRIAWRGDSAVDDSGADGEDLSGGYYDAADYVKFSFTAAFATTILSWGVARYRDAYLEADQYEAVLEALKWSTDYFVKCHPSKYVFYGQVGDFAADHAFWGRPEDLNMSRPAYRIDTEHPGSDLAGEASAALSSAYLVFRDVDDGYSKRLLSHAVELYDFANERRGFYEDAIPGADQFYRSHSYGDELTWAAVWLYKATSDPKYLKDGLEHYLTFHSQIEISNTKQFFYHDKLIGIQLLLAEVTDDGIYREQMKSFCDFVIDHQHKTPKGLVFIAERGTLSHASNVAFICLLAADLPKIDMDKKKILDFVKKQIDYILGANGFSYLVGYGKDYPRRPHHAASSCPDMPAPCGWEQFNATAPNPQLLKGALVSGPDAKDSFMDSREETLFTDVNLDYNAGFQSVLAGLVHHRVG